MIVSNRSKGWRLGVVAAGLLSAGAGADVFYAGRTLEDERDARVSLEGGAIVSMEGFVNETHRTLYDVTGHQYKQNPEEYNFTDFDVNGGYAVGGLSFEKAAKYVTLEGRALYMNPTIEATARRNYYLEVGEIDFNGQTYTHLKIPAGSTFSAEFEGALFDVNTLLTPFTVRMGESARLTPWLGLGIFGLAGTYTIDAGEPTGTTTYQNPPQEFVVGGHATGSGGAALPELVGGGELEFGHDRGTHFALQGYVGFFSYSGSSSYFSSNDENYDNHADIDHFHARVRAALDFPFESGHALTLGMQYEYVDTKATLNQEGKTSEEILAQQPSYDKEAQLKMSTATAFIGYAF